MNIEREIKIRDAVKYCIENFDSKTATNRIVEFWKDELKLQQQLALHNAVERSEQFFCCKDQINQRCSEQCLGCFQFQNQD